jgi:hypothetical protein
VSIKEKNKLYKAFEVSSNVFAEIKYKKYKKQLTNLLRSAEKHIMPLYWITIKIIFQKHGKLSVP